VIGGEEMEEGKYSVIDEAYGVVLSVSDFMKEAERLYRAFEVLEDYMEREVGFNTDLYRECYRLREELGKVLKLGNDLYKNVKRVGTYIEMIKEGE
jgi:hypothetical protein